MTRERKSPRARAEEALGVAQRKVARLEAERAKHEEALKGAETKLAAAVRRLDYVTADPDLPKQGKTTTSSSGGRATVTTDSILGVGSRDLA